MRQNLHEKSYFLLNFKRNSLLKIGLDDFETFPVSIMVSVHWIQKGSNLMPSDTKIFLVPNSILAYCARVYAWRAARIERLRSSHQPR